jgi:hypothetical protein
MLATITPLAHIASMGQTAQKYRQSVSLDQMAETSGKGYGQILRDSIEDGLKKVISLQGMTKLIRCLRLLVIWLLFVSVCVVRTRPKTF